MSVQPASSSDLLIDSLDLLSDLLSRFEAHVRTKPAIQSSSMKAISPLLSHQRPAVRKRAVSAVATLVSASGSGENKLFDDLIDNTIVPYLKSGKTEEVKTATGLVGALAR